jgi:hypothetical protein
MRKRRRLSSQNAFSPPTHSCIRRRERAFVSIPSPFFSSLNLACSRLSGGSTRASPQRVRPYRAKSIPSFFISSA